MNPVLPLDTLTRVVRRLPGGGLSAARQAALASFAERGFPSLSDEDWKYTDLTPAIDVSREWLAAGGPAETPDPAGILAVRATLDAHWLVIANGELQEAQSNALTLPGIRARRGHVGETRFEAPLSDLNAALSHDVLELTIGREYRDEKPIVLLVADAATGAPIASQVRIAVRLEDSAVASFVEYHVSSGNERHYSNTFIETDVAPDACCRWVRVQERAPVHTQTARLDVRLDHGARLEHFGIDLGGALTRNDLRVDVVGRHAQVTLDGVYLAGPGQHVDNHTRTEHRVGPARSRQEYRGVLSGRCRAVWNGKAIIHPGADGTDLEQANHNLLLSGDAEIDAKPELEIYADDVKAAHGATVGQLDERALFYLQSRGIGPARAKRILTRAFAATVLDKLPLPCLRELVGDKVEARLRGMAGGATA
ncbi:MAG TPA: Fe-S cluster assembly protein SufD [Woeseiaceae bacterium]|nr:Fe-S cluster assembly protein SufD [Woeseiaceae bacterium]